MHTVARKTTRLSPHRHLKYHNSHKFKSLGRGIQGNIQKMYMRSLRKIKGNPYQSTGILVGLGLLSGLVFWYRFRK